MKPSVMGGGAIVAAVERLNGVEAMQRALRQVCHLAHHQPADVMRMAQLFTSSRASHTDKFATCTTPTDVQDVHLDYWHPQSELWIKYIYIFLESLFIIIFNDDESRVQSMMRFVEFFGICDSWCSWGQSNEEESSCNRLRIFELFFKWFYCVKSVNRAHKWFTYKWGSIVWWWHTNF